jgi:hypothetical protein
MRNFLAIHTKTHHQTISKITARQGGETLTTQKMTTGETDITGMNTTGETTGTSTVGTTPYQQPLGEHHFLHHQRLCHHHLNPL